MLRCWLPLTALTLLAGCAASLEPPKYPQTVAGDYQLYHEIVLTGEQIPKVVPTTGLIRAVQLVYNASNPIQVTVFETGDSRFAREAEQRWRDHDGRQAQRMGRFFVVAQGEKPDPRTIEAFLRDFEKQLD